MKLIKPDVSIEEALKNPEKWIPDGCYCYRLNYESDEVMSFMSWCDGTGYLCPFWERIPDREPMEDGYCHYLKKGDVEFYEEDNWLSLLWDQCKECGINDEDWMYE